MTICTLNVRSFPVLTFNLTNSHHIKPFDTYCCHMGTSMKLPVPDRVKMSFVIFDIQELCHSAMSVRGPGCKTLQMTT